MERSIVGCRQKGWNWYGVRTLYRTVASGKAKNVDENFVPGATMVEERVVLFKARSGEEAISKGVREAKDYARSLRYSNLYGQRVRKRFLKVADAHELSDPPNAGVEVFSATELVDSSESDTQVLQRLIDYEEDKALAGGLAIYKCRYRQAPPRHFGKPLK